jgi:ABC-type lipoprotein export system ATPase subunit
VLIRLRDITVRFGTRTVFDGFDLDLEAGTLIGLVGPSGSGKSTLLALLAGRQRPAAGTVELPTALLTEGRLHPRDVGWIMQSANVFPRRTVTDNVAMAALVGAVDPPTLPERTAAAIIRVGLADHAEDTCHSLSGGEQQRVVVARALVADTPLLLADEPTAALDAGNRDRLIAALTETVRPDRFTVLATHDMAVAAACDRIVELTP